MDNMDVSTARGGVFENLDERVKRYQPFRNFINRLPSNRLQDSSFTNTILKLDADVLTDRSFIDALSRLNSRDDDIITNGKFSDAILLMKDEFLRSGEFFNFTESFNTREELDALESRGDEFGFLGRLDADWFEPLSDLDSSVLNDEVFNDFLNTIDIGILGDGSFASFINDSESSTLTDASFTITLGELDGSVLTNGKFTNDLQRISKDFLESFSFYQFISDRDSSKLASRGNDYTPLPSIGGGIEIPRGPEFITRTGGLFIGDNREVSPDSIPTFRKGFRFIGDKGAPVNEEYFMRGGDDIADGGNGIDNMSGGPGKDQLYGGLGGDFLFGNGGDDILFGGPGNSADYLEGGYDDDQLFGEGGDDVLVGLSSRFVPLVQYHTDALTGGRGADTFVMATRSPDAGRRYDNRQTAVIRDFNPNEGDIIELEGDFSMYRSRYDGANTLIQYIEGRQFDPSAGVDLKFVDFSIGETVTLGAARYDIVVLENFEYTGTVGGAERAGWIDFSES